ncbi:SCO2522 family protein [Actinocorallia populi]|uniref:SCO2522 family protein n=1 Tax=Actinocorallia populi TaxID=2079200 RepID=UPI0018E4F804|nr:SCO2522 family protein [Actinocorallia populi]
MNIPRLEASVLTDRPRVERVPRSHLSLELGHLYMEDLLSGPDALRRHFARIRPWAEFVLGRYANRRVSTCFLVDEYFSRIRKPVELIPELLEAAEREGITLDYVARESACADAGQVSPAALVLERVVPDPPPGTDGTRPPVKETGWLTNSEGMAGTREPREAMAGSRGWSPPRQNDARLHSICVDVQLWDEPDGERRWSCAFLAAVWQLLRLGVLRDEGKAIVTPQRWPREKAYPDEWHDLPPVVQLSERAHPFAAFRTMTVLETRFSDVEAAVRLILGQVAVDPVVIGQIREQAGREGIDVPDELVRRVEHVFTDHL